MYVIECLEYELHFWMINLYRLCLDITWALRTVLVIQKLHWYLYKKYKEQNDTQWNLYFKARIWITKPCFFCQISISSSCLIANSTMLPLHSASQHFVVILCLCGIPVDFFHPSWVSQMETSNKECWCMGNQVLQRSWHQHGSRSEAVFPSIGPPQDQLQTFRLVTCGYCQLLDSCRSSFCSFSYFCTFPLSRQSASRMFRNTEANYVSRFLLCAPPVRISYCVWFWAFHTSIGGIILWIKNAEQFFSWYSSTIAIHVNLGLARSFQLRVLSVHQMHTVCWKRR